MLILLRRSGRSELSRFARDSEDLMALSSQAPCARPLLRLGAAMLALVASLSAAAAQGLECSRLQAQIASMGPGDANAAAGFADAARRQQYELERTQAYAQGIGCNNKQLPPLIFAKVYKPSWKKEPLALQDNNQ